MRIDLFELVDGLIRGVIHFLYNFIETTAAILRHPIRGPLRLTRRHDDPAIRQMGGSTYLFLIVLPVQKLWIDAGAGRDGEASFGEFLTKISMQAPDFQSDALWPDIVAALIATVIVDGVLRLMLRWRVPNRRRFRHALLSATEFAMAWPILVLLTYSVLAVLVDMEDQLIGLAGGLALTIAVPASLYPAAAILPGARPRRGTGRRRGKRA